MLFLAACSGRSGKSFGVVNDLPGDNEQERAHGWRIAAETPISREKRRFRSENATKAGS
jgi:hypothetical protein